MKENEATEPRWSTTEYPGAHVSDAVKVKEGAKPSWGKRFVNWLGLAAATMLLEGAAWAVLRQMGNQRTVAVMILGTFALLATACVFAPARWLRHPDIAGPAADYPMLIRATFFVGSGVLWLVTYFMLTSK